MTEKTIRDRIVTGWLATMLLASGAARADTPPAAGPPTASPVRSEVASASAPRPRVSSDADASWLYESLIVLPPAGACPLRPADATRPKALETKPEPALSDVQVPATVRNLRRADGR